jgi:hypothetical protein
MGAGAREPEARGPRRGGRRRTPVASRLLVTRALDKDESEAVGADDEARRRHTAVTAGQRNRALVKRAGPVHDLRDRAVGRSTFIIGFGAPLYQMQGVPIQKRNPEGRIISGSSFFKKTQFNQFICFRNGSHFVGAP